MMALKEGRHQAAADLLGRAVSFNAQKSDYHYCPGAAYRGLGDAERAVACYRTRAAAAAKLR